eukprot:825899-Amphidinium_carterae.1
MAERLHIIAPTVCQRYMYTKAKKDFNLVGAQEQCTKSLQQHSYIFLLSLAHSKGSVQCIITSIRHIATATLFEGLAKAHAQTGIRNFESSERCIKTNLPKFSDAPRRLSPHTQCVLALGQVAHVRRCCVARFFYYLQGPCSTSTCLP